MKGKVLTLFTCIFISLSILGFVYAQWNDVLTISTTMSFGTENMGFVEPIRCIEYYEDPATSLLVPGEYLGKDVGNSECEYQEPKTDSDTGKQAYKKLTIILNNVYPGYIVHCNFTLENIGTLPIHIKESVISDPKGILTWDSDKKALISATGNPIIGIAFNPELVSTTLQPNDDPATPGPDNKAEFEMSIRITQDAEEYRVYTFEVKINYEVVVP